MAKKKDYWATVYRFAWGILFVVLLIALACIFLPKCSKVRDYQQKKIELTEQKRQREMVIQDLKLNQEKFRTDPGFVEGEARRGGRVKDGEVVFKFTNKQSQATGRTP